MSITLALSSGGPVSKSSPPAPSRKEHLLRVYMTMAADSSAPAAWATLKAIEALPGHEFWDDGFSYSLVPHRLLQGPSKSLTRGLSNSHADVNPSLQHLTRH